MNRRDWVKTVGLPLFAGNAEQLSMRGERAHAFGSVRVHPSAESIWSLVAGPMAIAFAPPSIPTDGRTRVGRLQSIQASGDRKLPNGVVEQRFTGPFRDDSSLSLELIFQTSEDSPVIRFRYALQTASNRLLTGDGAQIRYFAVSLAEFQRCTEVQLANFNEVLHSYTILEIPVNQAAFQNQSRLVGPILVASNGSGRSLLLSYEHGAQAPDSFLGYCLAGNRRVTLQAFKANYVPGQSASGFSTIWMHAALLDGDISEAAAQYRYFVLKHLSANQETRRPYIFYNTWNFQERNKWFNGKSYLESMNPKRILAEIDVANRMGIEVFVLDTGWYEKTGDWNVSGTRFGQRFKEIRERLDQHGMRLGLWLDPTAAAQSSQMLRQNRACVRTRKGKEDPPRRIWETEQSYAMCLVSFYADAFAESLIRIANETGARYFKWDAIAQYGCDSPDHWHGTESNNEAERWDSYAFQLPLQMIRVAEKVAASVPGIIIDFDITEAGRSVGLSFLAAGRYFLINNGPYLFNYDLPMDRERQNWNLFFYPGPARTWICRSPLTYDKWIPMNLFLTHYFPDEPASSQLVNAASLVLGQNGIWGDLLSVPREGVERIGRIVSLYKMVRDDVALSSPITVGAVGDSPEVYEKISALTGRGLVALFATAKGKFRYITAHRPLSSHHYEGRVAVHFDANGRAVLDCEFDQAGAAIVFFGT